MGTPLVLEGTWEELKLHDRELSGKRFRLIAIPREPSSDKDAPRRSGQKPRRQLTGMGKFAGIIPCTEEFMRQKQEEIEVEDRNLGK